MSIINFRKLNNIEYIILEFEDDSEKLAYDFKYIFDEKIKITDIIKFDSNSFSIKEKNQALICCTYDKNEAKKKLEKKKLLYQRDYLFADDYFCILDDWNGKKIAYKTYKFDLIKWRKTLTYGYAAKHGKVLWNDRYREILKGRYINNKGNKYSKHLVQNKVTLGRCLEYALYLLLGLIDFLPQIGAKKRHYDKYDYICFYEILDAIKFKKDFPELSSKVITTEELKNHTMASLYMKAVYYDRRQNDCGCKVPLETIWIGDKGTTRLCGCPDYLDISCGNMGITDNDEIWNSTLAKIMRLSVINNTYTFCSRELCREFNGNPDGDKLLERKEADFTREYPNIIKVANDYVCNLHCPSCRKMIHAKNDDNEELEIVTCIDSLMESGWLDKANNVVVGASGESFLSPSYRKIIFDGVAHRNSIDIMTNGTLFTPQIWEKMEGKYKHVTFSVSIDAATKETYEKVRCGGNWDKLMENMAFLSKLRKENKVESVMVNMIVQKKNYREIPDFIRWAKEMEFDSVYLSHIWNWGTFSADEFENEVSMFDKDGKMKTELAKVLEDPICKDPIVDMRWE